MSDPTSRYDAVATARHRLADGTLVLYRKRRFLPQPEPSPAHRMVVVREGERLDLIAARLLGDPLQFWRIADSNCAMNPMDLAVPGSGLVVPGASHGGSDR
jgi:hypothetical protein